MERMSDGMSDNDLTTIDGLMRAHYKWVDDMGWHNKEPLESVALIHEEVAELGRELRGNVQDIDRIGEEMADVVLRVLDLAGQYGLNFQHRIINKYQRNIQRGTRGRVK
jgi:NTP pyrophosphatase (non-canonical NTP hydrolase)